MKKFIKSLLAVVFLVAFVVFQPAAGYASAQSEKKTDTTISFLGTLDVPAQLEIISIEDVFIEIIQAGEKLQEEKQTKEGSNTSGELPKKIPVEDLKAAFKKYDIGAYQFAFKQNASYNQAFVLAAKMPAQMAGSTGHFFQEMKLYDKKKQSELKDLTVKTIQETIASTPELKDSVSFELLEFYPFEYTKKDQLQMMSAGGSIAVRMYKMIQPLAFKIYLLEKNSDYYVFTVINSGPDRKLWDNMTKNMLLSLAH